jgi:hypothetical protein
MESYEGIIVFLIVDDAQKAYLEVEDSKTYLLIIEGLGSIDTFNQLVSIGFFNGQKVKANGMLYFHKEYSNTLFLKSNSAIEKM